MMTSNLEHAHLIDKGTALNSPREEKKRAYDLPQYVNIIFDALFSF